MVHLDEPGRDEYSSARMLQERVPAFIPTVQNWERKRTKSSYPPPSTQKPCTSSDGETKRPATDIRHAASAFICTDTLIFFQPAGEKKKDVVVEDVQESS